MEWQPIETAPKDGTKVLVSNGFEMQVAEFSDSNIFGHKEWVYGEIQNSYNRKSYVAEPTHWMPLPAAPND
jgi:hypothetical protein